MEIKDARYDGSRMPLKLLSQGDCFISDWIGPDKLYMVTDEEITDSDDTRRLCIYLETGTTYHIPISEIVQKVTVELTITDDSPKEM